MLQSSYAVFSRCPGMQALHVLISYDSWFYMGNATDRHSTQSYRWAVEQTLRMDLEITNIFMDAYLRFENENYVLRKYYTSTVNAYTSLQITASKVVFHHQTKLRIMLSSDEKQAFLPTNDGMEIAPAQSAVQYITQAVNYDIGPLTGEPRLELDQAWSRLLRPTVVRVTKDELERMNKSSIALRNGTGYIGYLEVHHMLHCVKRLYQLQYPEYYTGAVADGALSIEHRDHCLNVLIEGIMCNADTTINTYAWKNNHEIRGSRTGSRRCTDWDHLQAWANQRTLQIVDRSETMAALVPSDEFEVVESMNY
ncbi:hypothetical protein GQX73_g10561 [Xylaria multiplex]|uniref:Uncharacterized protein n=1 Tax=Xylaria multiplex TaxID=323545 RepID=A0A7C8MJL4_9PEZI|nr:hypothetical protein GQX73_g10561 [Xylaria multiplex]